MKKIIYLILIFLIFYKIKLFSNEKNKGNLWSTNEKTKYYYIEKIDNYKSVIDWTEGKIKTTLEIEVNDNNPNIGMQRDYYFNILKEELRNNLIKAMGYLRISDIFLLSDYYSMKSDLRYEIISYSDKAFYYPPVRVNNKLIGKVELNIFGENGIANLFYRNIDKVSLNKYMPLRKSKERDFYEGLIIDTSLYPEYKPCILMRIYDQDDMLIYGPETIDKKILNQKGVCEYTSSLNLAFKSKRIGQRIFYIIPYEVKGKMSTYFVFHNRDVSRLFSHPDTIKYLNDGNVVVFKPIEGE